MLFLCRVITVHCSLCTVNLQLSKMCSYAAVSAVLMPASGVHTLTPVRPPLPQTKSQPQYVTVCPKPTYPSYHDDGYGKK